MCVRRMNRLRMSKNKTWPKRKLLGKLLIVITIFTLVIPSLFAHHAGAISGSQGPKTATSSANCVDLAGVGTITWGTPANAQTANTVYSTATITSTATTHYLKCTGFGFTLPASGVTVAGITATITRKAATAARLADSTVSLVKGGVVTGSNKALAATWTATNTAFNYGAANDLWATAWTAADINAANFGLVISAKNNTATSTVASVDALTLTVAYNFNATFTQSSYRWFNNADSAASPIDVGTPLNGVAQNTPTTALAEQAIFRLRMGVHIGTDVAPAGAGLAFRLQYAARGSDNTCDTAFANESYADVTAATPIAYANNTLATDGMTVKTNANNPAHNADTTIFEEYNELNDTGVINTIAAGQDGLWDFALKDNAAPGGTTYCLRMADTTGTAFAATVVPQITTLALAFNQSGYRWFNNQDSSATSTFVSTWGAGPGDFAYCVTPTSDGGYIVSGDDYSYGAGGSDAIILKYDSKGVLEWSRTWGGTGSEQGTSVTQTTDGGFVMAGLTTSYGSGGNDGYVAKFTSTGTLSWSRIWGGTSDDYSYEVTETTDGGVVVSGVSNSASMGGFGGYDAILLKYDSTGALSWKKAWGGVNDEYGQGVTQTADGGYAMSGNTNTWAVGNYDPFLAKLTSAGALSWSVTANGTGFEDCFEVIQTSDGGYALTGNTTSWPNTSSGDNMYIIKFTSTGTVSWTRAWGGPPGNTGNDNGKSLIETADNGIVVAGSTFTYGAGSDDILLVKYASNGTFAWNKTWGGTGTDFGKWVSTSADGGIAAAGLTYSYAAGDGDVALLKFASDGTIAGCSSPMCQSPTATTSSPAITSTACTVTLKDVTPTTSSPTVPSSDPGAMSRFVLSTNIDVNEPLNAAAINAPTMSHDTLQTFRLRLLLHDSNKASPLASQLFKLQYAARGGDGVCDTSFVNETYADVTEATPIAYANNPVATDSQLVLADANDPTHSSDTKIMQEYTEASTYFSPNGITNPKVIAIGQDGLWDFSLKENGAPAAMPYCLRMVYYGGTPLASYSVIPEITTSVPLDSLLRGGQSVQQGTRNQFLW